MNKYIYILIVACCVSFYIGISLRPNSSKPTATIVTPQDSTAKVESPKPDNTDMLIKIQQSEFEVDFKAMNAFSFERTIEKGIPVTIVGYRGKNGEIALWYLYCSEENHKRLAEQFKRDILNK
jgi:hypothetical protein